MQSTLYLSANVSAKNSIIFGPINSRRFGMSLGVDLSPAFKQCNFDCLYCELAPATTTNKQVETIQVQEVIQELKTHLTHNIDVITLTANGEPTLYPHLNDLIDKIDTIKGATETLILTNSAALINPIVYDALLKLDQVKLSLDAVTPDIFKKIDRPHKSINITELVERVVAFSKEYRGKLFIEILFVHELNNTKEELVKLNNVLLRIDAVRIDLGTIDRPPAYPVVGINYKELYDIAISFDKTLPIHIASRTHVEPNNITYTKEEILNTLDKRPLTQEDITLLFDEKSKVKLQELIASNEVTIKTIGNLKFLLPSKNIKRKRVLY